MVHQHSRRRFLGGVATTAAWSGAGALLARLARAAPAKSSLSAIEHVVIFTQENRSFDHYLGTLSGVRGFGDRRALRQLSGRSVFGQASGSGPIYPYRLDNATSAGQCIADVSHTWSSGHDATRGGRQDGWIAAKGSPAMGYHARADIPYLYGLADAFTVCDHYFCSVNSSTDPNRHYLMTGMIDPDAMAGGPATGNDVPADGFTWTTYPERLQQKNVSWRVYQEVENFDDNALAWYKQFKTASVDSPLYLNGMARFPRTQFKDDVEKGTLPTVSWIVAPAVLSEHPDYAPNAGMNYGALNFLAPLLLSPLWQKTAFIWTYDENGGFFDHIAPPTPPPGTPGEFIDGEPIGLGTRVPTLVISPWSRGGHVCSQVFDHTSTLQFLELVTGVAEPNISAWRREVCGDLTSAFDFTSVSLAVPELPDSQAAADAAAYSCANRPAAAPGGETSAPKPEPGQRPLRALPYQLSAGLRVAATEHQLEVTVQNAGSSGCALQLYHTYETDRAPVHLTIAAGATQTRRLLVPTTNRYDLELRGPNGFVRIWRGDASLPEPEVEMKLDADGGTVELTLTNPTGVSIELAISSDLPELAAGAQNVTVAALSKAQVSLPTTDAWYDYILTPRAVGGVWRRELAGHIEGQASRTLST